MSGSLGDRRVEVEEVVEEMVEEVVEEVVVVVVGDEGGRKGVIGI